MMGTWECRAALLLAKASAVGEGTGLSNRWAPRGRRGWHVEKEHAVKARNHSRVASAHQHSEGISYKPQGGEVGVCPRAGRMRSNKR
jgi:hypothetical protein